MRLLFGPVASRRRLTSGPFLMSALMSERPELYREGIAGYATAIVMFEGLHARAVPMAAAIRLASRKCFSHRFAMKLTVALVQADSRGFNGWSHEPLRDGMVARPCADLVPHVCILRILEVR